MGSKVQTNIMTVKSLLIALVLILELNVSNSEVATSRPTVSQSSSFSTYYPTSSAITASHPTSTYPPTSSTPSTSFPTTSHSDQGCSNVNLSFSSGGYFPDGRILVTKKTGQNFN